MARRAISMDAPLNSHPVDPAAQDPWTEQFCRALALEHGRVREFLGAKRRRRREIEEQLLRQIERLTGEARTLHDSCAELERKLAERPAETARPAGEPDPEGLYRRYEMALCDLRELKARNADLQKQLTQLASWPSQTGMPGGVLDWESEKRRILAALESCETPDGQKAGLDRLRIEGLVAQTDRLLAEKDCQLEEMRKLVGGADGSRAAAAAREEILDRDAVIRQERENLQRLQEECRVKLGQAEVALSVDRAKLARQQAEIEEKLRVLGAAGGAEPPQQAEHPVRGRWLSRLGLSGDGPPRPR
jgi:DNA repair exonuclease SbcCD ATPase subunit